jgi:hypothetical protein
MQWNKVKSHHLLIDEIRKGIDRVPKNDLLRELLEFDPRNFRLELFILTLTHP